MPLCHDSMPVMYTCAIYLSLILVYANDWISFQNIFVHNQIGKVFDIWTGFEQKRRKKLKLNMYVMWHLILLAYDLIFRVQIDFQHVRWAISLCRNETEIVVKVPGKFSMFRKWRIFVYLIFFIFFPNKYIFYYRFNLNVCGWCAKI